ncbi:pentapeptide repeat-containing protein [Streptomyces sp. NPDC048560]|uniref:pentapeptide repeat-containing protein n=1 Tax=Streptomyces sp. NPDC048560 TaxID=3155488 RepID=UPI00343A3B5C
MANATHVKLLNTLDAAEEREPILKDIAALTADLLHNTGRGLQLADANLANLDLADADLTGAVLNRATLHSTSLRGAFLDRVTMICPGMERTDLTGASMRDAYVHALAAQTSIFDNADLSNLRDATGSLFHGCSMRGTAMPAGQLAGTTFYQCDLEGADLKAANLQGATFNESVLRETDFGNAVADQLTVTKSDMAGARLSGMTGTGVVIQRATNCDGLDLSGARLPSLRLDGLRGHSVVARDLHAPDADIGHCCLPSIDLSAAALPGLRLRDSDLAGAKLSAASLVAASVHRTCLSDADLVNVQAENLHVVESQLRHTRMRGFTGRCAVFRDVDMRGADLSQSNLYRAMITGDPPRGMCLAEASLAGAILVQAYIAADLSSADLREVNAAYSRFSQSDLTGADLTGAALFQSTWVKVTCRRTKLAGVKPPFFADRCAGLKEALEEAETPDAVVLSSYLTAFDDVLRGEQHGST